MSFCIISFTKNGFLLSEKIADCMKTVLQKEKIQVYVKCSKLEYENDKDVIFLQDKSVGAWARQQMQEKNAILFIGACGIAVRAIAPSVNHKLTDSPVLVMDEKGAFVIPILSGHVGGANELALQLAKAMGATPVITTATDINHVFSVDLFAKKNDFHIGNKDGIAKVSAKVLAGKTITMSVEDGHFVNPVNKPKEIELVEYPPVMPVDVLISTKENPCDALLYLHPRQYVLGMGCKKGKEPEKIAQFIDKTLQNNGIHTCDIAALCSIDVKKEEAGLLEWSQTENKPFLTFSAKQLLEAKGSFSTSEFVKSQVGVDNVCERAAICGSNLSGELILKKQAEDGMTIAIVKKEWRVSFDEE